MKALILLADRFDELQYFVLWSRLREEGLSVTLASPTGRAVTGLRGEKVEIDMPIREVNQAEYELLVVPGGYAAEELRLREEAVDIARTFIDNDRWVATVGHGIQLLLSSGALSNRSATCSPALRDDVRAVDANYRNEAVVVDRNLITGRGLQDLPSYCRALISSIHVSAS